MPFPHRFKSDCTDQLEEMEDTVTPIPEKQPKYGRKLHVQFIHLAPILYIQKRQYREEKYSSPGYT